MPQIQYMDNQPANPELMQQLEVYIASEVLKQPARRIDARAPLISSGLVDSFNLVGLALYVEEQFGVHIDDTELSASTFDTLEQLAELIRLRRRQ
jgi:acyl carrier protein